MTLKFWRQHFLLFLSHLTTLFFLALRWRHDAVQTAWLMHTGISQYRQCLDISSLGKGAKFSHTKTQWHIPDDVPSCPQVHQLPTNLLTNSTGDGRLADVSFQRTTIPHFTYFSLLHQSSDCHGLLNQTCSSNEKWQALPSISVQCTPLLN